MFEVFLNNTVLDHKGSKDFIKMLVHHFLLNFSLFFLLFLLLNFFLFGLSFFSWLLVRYFDFLVFLNLVDNSSQYISDSGSSGIHLSENTFVLLEVPGLLSIVQTTWHVLIWVCLMRLSNTDHRLSIGLHAWWLLLSCQC